MFHYFRPESDDAPDSSIRRLSIPPETLDKQVRELKAMEKENQIRLVPMSALDALTAGKCPTDEKPVLTVLTVDDAWSDAYDVGFKTFKKYGVPFSLSTISRFTGSGGLRYQGFADRKEIAEMVKSGYGHVLSHSLDHKDFGYLSDSGSESEICDSRKDLERQFGQKIDDFVFPAGHVDGYADGWLKNCGYSRAFLTKPGKITRKDLLSNPYSLPRLRVTSTTDMRNLIF
ncbi:MAG: polysaccharide deacetylase family protein [Patescibacteria group bacterium]